MGKLFSGDKPVRESNFELLKVIVMMFAMNNHYFVYGGVINVQNQPAFNVLWYQISDLIGRSFLCCFLLISGYFLVQRDKFNGLKMVRMWIQIFTYSVGVYLILCATGFISFEGSEFVKCLFPITTRQWWFASAYFIMYLLSPFINKGLNRLSKREYQILIAIMVVLWSIIPTITLFKYDNDSSFFLWFIILYVIGGYLRLWVEKPRFKIWQYILIIIGLVAVMFVIYTILCNTMAVDEASQNRVNMFIDMRQFFILCEAICVFSIFRQIKIKPNRLINTLSTCVFGVYLMHDNLFMERPLWIDKVKGYMYAGSLSLVPRMLVTIVILFFIFAAIEFIRMTFIEKYYMRAIEKLINRFKKEKKVSQ